MARNDTLRRALGLALLAAGALFSGCAAGPATSGPRDGVAIHVWTPLSRQPQAPWQGPRTRLYTFVLAGDAGANDAEGGGTARTELRKAVEVVLREVQSNAASSDVEAALLKQANQFVLPARGPVQGPFRLEHYDFALSAAMLNRLRAGLPQSPLSTALGRPGPFLVATRQPLDELVRSRPDGTLRFDESSPVLLVDMSGRHPGSMPAYVNAFKDAVRRTLPSQSVELAPLRAEFASALIRVSEALPFVAEAYAGTLKTFGLPAPGAGAPP